MFETQTVIWAFALTLIAGLATGIGAAFAFFAKHTNIKFLSIALGFSAGVMIYVSFVEILPEAKHLLISVYNLKEGSYMLALCFFLGMLVVALIDKFIPTFENPHEVKNAEEMDDLQKARQFRKLYRVGFLAALAIIIHNTPEGIVTFMSTLADPKLGLMIAFAVVIHNIPEGIAVAVPIYYATQNRKKAFLFSFFSGFAEPLGALIAYFFLIQFYNDALLGGILASVAGIMVFVSLDELLPAAQKFGEHHLSIYGLVLGMMFMSISLLLFL